MSYPQILHLKLIFSLENKEKSQGFRSGEYGGEMLNLYKYFIQKVLRINIH